MLHDGSVRVLGLLHLLKSYVSDKPLLSVRSIIPARACLSSCFHSSRRQILHKLNELLEQFLLYSESFSWDPLHGDSFSWHPKETGVYTSVKSQVEGRRKLRRMCTPLAGLLAPPIF